MNSFWTSCDIALLKAQVSESGRERTPIFTPLHTPSMLPDNGAFFNFPTFPPLPTNTSTGKYRKVCFKSCKIDFIWQGKNGNFLKGTFSAARGTKFIGVGPKIAARQHGPVLHYWKSGCPSLPSGIRHCCSHFKHKAGSSQGVTN